MPQGQLAQVLSGLLGDRDERLLVGPATMDDAGVVRLREADGLPADASVALVQTVDYFPPVVDDPWFYGAIAAANALSDVYAMGARPLSVLTLAGFPEALPDGWLREIFRGAFDKVREAEAVVCGGHTVRSEEALFGFAVTGIVDPGRVITNAGAEIGDLLYLTKPIGMGAMTTAGKLRKIDRETLRPAAEQMATLNTRAAEAMVAAGASACTDVTGFGLVGHAHNVARASGVTLRFHLAEVPLFPGAPRLAARGILSGASQRGRRELGPTVGIAEGLDEAIVNLAFDAETSGGLLIALPADRTEELERELAARDQLVCRIGECVPSSERAVELT